MKDYRLSEVQEIRKVHRCENCPLHDGVFCVFLEGEAPES